MNKYERRAYFKFWRLGFGGMEPAAVMIYILIVHIIVTANYDDGLIFLTFLGEGGYEKNKRFIRDFL